MPRFLDFDSVDILTVFVALSATLGAFNAGHEKAGIGTTARGRAGLEAMDGF